MEKAGAGGRPMAIDMWEHVTVLEGKKRVKCKYCGFEFAASANRIKSHIHQIKGLGIRLCTQFPQLNNIASNEEKQDFLDLQGSSILDRPREYDKLNRTMLDCYMSPKTMWDGIKSIQQVQSITEDMHQGRIKVGPFYVSSIVNESDLQLIQHSFEHSSDRCILFTSSRSFLCQSQLTTIRPQAHLDSWVIDIFADILTEIERRKKSEPLNWYLPVMFSTAALNSGDISSFIDFVQRNNMRDNYMSDLAYCEKIFIPVHVGKNSSGHYYLYIIHIKNQQVEIWDSLCEQFMDKTKRDQITEKLLLAMEKLFVDAKFTKFHKKMARNILLQPNGYDCGIFIINYMQQSDNYVRINPSFQFDSHKERLDLVLKLLKSNLNREKGKLYDEAAKCCAKVQGYQDLDSGHFKRKQCKTMFEDVGRGAYMKSEDSDDGVRINNVGLITESPIPVCVSPFRDDIDGDHPELKPDSKKRKMIPKWIEQAKPNSETTLEGTVDDGFCWEKYGQKDILGAKYPRCAFCMTHNCSATKEIQRSNEDPSVFEITYQGTHTCSSGSNEVQPPKSPDQQQEKIHNYDLDTDNLDNEEKAECCAKVQHFLDLDSGHFKRMQCKTILGDVGRGAYMKSDDSHDGDRRNNVGLITGSLILDESRDYNKPHETMLDCYINEFKKELELATRPREYAKLSEAMLDCYMSPKTMWDGIKSIQQVQINIEAMHQVRIKVGPFYVSSTVNESDLRLIQYSFEHSSDRRILFSSSRSFLCQSQLTTIRPQAHLDSWVIDIFADILTEIERRKESEPLNWYLPVMFSTAALNSGDISSFIDFVQRNNMRDNYMSDFAYCEKIFIPVHVGKNSSGHYYLYIIHIKNQQVEIWDSLCEQFMDKTKRDQITEKLLLAMEKLFVDAKFTKFHKKMARNILLQPNGYDCGIFIINYMQQSDNYVRINPSFQFDSHKERLDLVLKLLKSNLNREKGKLYDEAAKCCAKVQGYQDLDSGHFKRKQCKTMFEDVGRGAYMKSEDSDDGVRINNVGLITESPIPVCVSPFRDDIDGDHPELKPDSKKRKMIPKWIEQAKPNSETTLEGTVDDGFCWEKYGQKDILGAKYPRSFYRCAFRMTHNCWATKEMQRSDEDPSVFEITYQGTHTCSSGSNDVQPPKSPDQQQEKIHNYDLDTDNLDNEEMAECCAKVQHFLDLDSGHFKRKQCKTILGDVGRGAYMKSDDSNDGDKRNNVGLITGSLILDESRDYNEPHETMLDCYINELKKELDLATNKDSRSPPPDKEQKTSNNQVNSKLLDLDIDVKIIGWDAMIQIRCRKGHHPAARLMVALQELDLEVKHASLLVVNDQVIQQATVEMGCKFFTQEQLRLALSFKLGDVR